MYNRHYEKVGNEVKDITDELPFEIPDSWCWARLGNIGDWGAGATPPRGVPEYYNGTVPWIKTGELNNGYINSSKETVTIKALQDCSLRYNQIGDILIAMYGATIGKLGIAGVRLTTNQACCACTPYNGLYNLYLFDFLKAEKEHFIELGAGGAQPNISREKIIQYFIPIPPLAEQKRIVAEIEKYEPLIAEYDKLEQQKNKIDGEIYDKLKKSILQYAIQGKLVPQDENDEPASELLKRIRAEKKAKLGKKYVDSYIYKGDDNCYYEHIEGKDKNEAIEVPFGLSESWAWVRIPEITYFQEGPGIMARDFRPQGIPLIRIAGMQTSKVSLSGCNYLDEDMVIKKWSHFRLDRGDIVISTSASMDKIAEVYDDTIGAIPYTGLIRFKMKDGLIKDYFKYYIQSDCYAKQIDEQKSGTTIQHYGPTHIQRMIIPIPPIEEQQRIVDKINEIFAKL